MTITANRDELLVIADTWDKVADELTPENWLKGWYVDDDNRSRCCVVGHFNRIVSGEPIHSDLEHDARSIADEVLVSSRDAAFVVDHGRIYGTTTFNDHEASKLWQVKRLARASAARARKLARKAVAS